MILAPKNGPTSVICSLTAGSAAQRRTVCEQVVISSATSVTSMNLDFCKDLGLPTTTLDSAMRRGLEESLGTPLTPGAAVVDSSLLDIMVSGVDGRRTLVTLEPPIEASGHRFLLVIPNAPRRVQFGKDFLKAMGGEM
jgi:hypothetical protein